MPLLPDVLIIGGGAIGLSTAYFLAKEQIRVQIVDKGEFGQESSWAGAGIIPSGNGEHAQTDLEQLLAQSVRKFPSLSAELRELTGIDNGYLVCGGLELIETEISEQSNEWRSPAVKYQWLDGQAVRKIEPELTPGIGGGYLLPEMAQVRNPRHIQALVAACKLMGVDFLSGCEARGFEMSVRRISAVRTDRGDLTAGKFLISAGAWTDKLLDQVGWRPGVHPVRGQIVMLNTSRPLFRHIILHGPRYLVPRVDGRLLIGSTEEHAGFEKQTTAVAVADLIRFACSLVPALQQAPVERCWAGLRPGTADGLPYMGAVPGIDNLYVSAGHFRSGIQLSPGTGEVMKELLLGQKLSLPIADFRTDRPGTRAPTSAFRS